jgi:hypothetical protein
MGEYLHPHIELETPRVYVCMYTMVMDASTRRWILILQNLTSLSAAVPFLENFGGTDVGRCESHTLGPKMTKWVNIHIPRTELENS